MKNISRIVIAGVSGDSGKTLVSCGLLSALKNKGYSLAPFKKGPDYIDPSWLSLASGETTRNLDTYMMDENVVRGTFLKYAEKKDIAIIEGNRGLFDGFDEVGSHSTAELAKLIDSPVIIVLPVVKITRTAAAIILGCKELDKKLNIAGVILNQVAGKRHINIIKNTIESITHIPVIGAIPKFNKDVIFPARHLGLITPEEYDSSISAIEKARLAIEDNVDLDKLENIAKSASHFDDSSLIKKDNESVEIKVKIGYFYDRAFSFYYSENLEALEKAGAELVKISSINDSSFPDIDALYIGGGFPETNLDLLVNNAELLSSLKEKSIFGLPIYAECGGLIYLAESIEYNERNYKLSGVLPFKIKMSNKPCGHGYVDAVVDEDNRYFPKNLRIKAHEFHYSYICEPDENLGTCLKINVGAGAINGRDGMCLNNVFATYLHIHSAGCPQWAEGLVNQAIIYKNEQSRKK